MQKKKHWKTNYLGCWIVNETWKESNKKKAEEPKCDGGGFKKNLSMDTNFDYLQDNIDTFSNVLSRLFSLGHIKNDRLLQFVAKNEELKGQWCTRRCMKLLSKRNRAILGAWGSSLHKRLSQIQSQNKGVVDLQLPTALQLTFLLGG